MVLLDFNLIVGYQASDESGSSAVTKRKRRRGPRGSAAPKEARRSSRNDQPPDGLSPRFARWALRNSSALACWSGVRIAFCFSRNDCSISFAFVFFSSLERTASWRTAFNASPCCLRRSASWDLCVSERPSFAAKSSARCWRCSIEGRERSPPSAPPPPPRGPPAPPPPPPRCARAVPVESTKRESVTSNFREVFILGIGCCGQ